MDQTRTELAFSKAVAAFIAEWNASSSADAALKKAIASLVADDELEAIAMSVALNPEIGCGYCREDGDLVDGVCPKCDAVYY